MQVQNQDYHIIETFNGPLLAEDIYSSLKNVLSEALTLPNSKKYTPCNRTLDLQNLNYHLSNPHSLQNTSLTPTLLQHELHNCNVKELLIVDSSHSYESKNIPDIFKKYNVVKGFYYPLRVDSLRTSPTLYDFEHVLKQLEYQFQLGNGVCRPGFIGEVDLCQIQDLYKIFRDEAAAMKKIHNVFRAYFKFSQNTHCPIIINCFSLTNSQSETQNRELGPQAVQIAGQQNQHLRNKYQSSYQLLQSLLQISKDYSVSTNLLIVNLPILLLYSTQIIPSQKCPSSTQTVIRVTNYFEERITSLRQKYSFTAVFQMLRYNQRNVAVQVASQVKGYPKNTILTAGVRYKTDLKNFAGDGVFFPTILQNITGAWSLSKQIIYQVTVHNFFNKLNWKVQKKIIKEVILWKCDYCHQDYPQDHVTFRKHAKQFCSTQCLRSFKF